ncbi:hypothetical protein L7F22_052452 [Adiantum nelumboides]|nr:hypothetical protein [Adiantum nelumboides]
MDEWLQEFSNWRTEEEEALEALKEFIEVLLPGCSVIHIEEVKAKEEERGKILPKGKGKAKVENVDAMPIKRARQEEAAMSETGERRKSKENGESSSKKKSKPRWKITIKDFALGFKRGLLTEVCEKLKISHRHSTPYYPQSNGLVEKANGIIRGIIRKMVESKPKRWDNFLDGAIWACRTTYRDATQFAPFHLVYGQEALQPIELNIATIKLTERQEQNNDEAWIDRLLSLVELEWKREAAYHCYERKALQLKDKLNEELKDKEIKEKSLVLRYNNALDNRFDAKFERRWEGPFIVKKAFTGGYYQLMDLNGKEHPRKVNGYRLKPYLSRILPVVFETKQLSKKTKKLDTWIAMKRIWSCKGCQRSKILEFHRFVIPDFIDRVQVLQQQNLHSWSKFKDAVIRERWDSSMYEDDENCENMPTYAKIEALLKEECEDIFWQKDKGYDFGSSYLEGLSDDVQLVNTRTNCICYDDSLECEINAIFALHAKFYDVEVQRYLMKSNQINEQKHI